MRRTRTALALLAAVASMVGLSCREPPPLEPAQKKAPMFVCFSNQQLDDDGACERSKELCEGIVEDWRRESEKVGRPFAPGECTGAAAAYCLFVRTDSKHVEPVCLRAPPMCMQLAKQVARQPDMKLVGSSCLQRMDLPTVMEIRRITVGE